MWTARCLNFFFGPIPQQGHSRLEKGRRGLAPDVRLRTPVAEGSRDGEYYRAQKNWLITAAPYTENLGLGKKRLDLKSQIYRSRKIFFTGVMQKVYLDWEISPGFQKGAVQKLFFAVKPIGREKG